MMFTKKMTEGFFTFILFTFIYLLLPLFVIGIGEPPWPIG